MNAERWRQIEDIFQAALDLAPSERARFIEGKCGGDAELRGAVEKYIAGYEREETFLESPVWTDSRILQSQARREIAESLDEEIAPRQDEKSYIGASVGVYRLTEEIGRGGMGVVYRAERADGEFQQKAAVKLIKRGMDTDFIVRRFRRERQILADLNHPNIARLFDGGSSPDGLPYFVMEYIKGEPFLNYCEQKNLDLRGKLQLFLQVCAPVIYAHKRKIIHRDIKPSNILVTDEGEPKLLDFGIAKILETNSIHESHIPTATAMRLMTPEYASPEQVRGEEITPASDQYSLGVLLYELLTGERPYRFPSRAPHEIARVICEEMPSEPSSGSFGRMTAKNLPFSADFCKNLDRIALKALRKNPSERYASVADFAADIERFLRNEVVRAESFDARETNIKDAPSSVPFEKVFQATNGAPVPAGEKRPRFLGEPDSPRRRGFIQGAFLTGATVLLIPAFLVASVTAIIQSPLVTLIFLLLFFGGIIRALYALLFESKAQLAPAADKKRKETSSARRKGIKQGIFMIVLFVVCIPFFNIIIKAEILPPPVMTVIFLLIFFAGIARVLYALLLENAKDEADLPVVSETKIGEAETNLINPIAPRVTLASKASPEIIKTAEETDDDSGKAEKSIAVLPFKNLNTHSGETTGSGEFLSVGLADALISRLSNVRKLLVRPTSSILHFTDADAFQAGEELKVQYVLSGNILPADKKIRVSVQLLDVRKKATIWARRFDEDSTDFLDIEDSISSQVADSLTPHLTGAEREKLEKRGTNSPEAYEVYLRGRFHWNNFTPDSFRQAISYYNRAIEIDPNFALAYAGIADYHIWLGVYGVLPTAEFYPAARDAARRAIQLDANLSEAHAALGLARFYGEYDWQASEMDLRRAVELNPHNSVARLWFAHVLFSQKRFAESRQHLEKALELDPFSFQHHNTLAWGYYFSRDFEKALAESERLIEQFPNVEQARFARVCFLNYAGETAEAEVEIHRAAQISNDEFFNSLGFAQVRAAQGDRRAVEELIAKTNASERKFSNYYLALFYNYLRDQDTAFSYLERALADHESLLVWIGVEPSFESLRDDDRYEQLLAKINHPLAAKKT